MNIKKQQQTVDRKDTKNSNNIIQVTQDTKVI